MQYPHSACQPVEQSNSPVRTRGLRLRRPWTIRGLLKRDKLVIPDTDLGTPGSICTARLTSNFLQLYLIQFPGFWIGSRRIRNVAAGYITNSGSQWTTAKAINSMPYPHRTISLILARNGTDMAARLRGILKMLAELSRRFNIHYSLMIRKSKLVLQC